MNPRLSICIPAYNMGAWLGAATRSALSVLPAEEVEVVVVDNCSTDNTSDVLRDFAHDDRLRIVVADEHLGMVENWNRAVRASSGEWCVLLSADDELHPEFWMQMRDDATPDAPWGAINQRVTAVGGFGIWGTESYGDNQRRVYDRPEIVRLSPRWDPFPLLTTAFRRDVFEALGGFSEARGGPSADHDFFNRCVLFADRPILALGVEGGTYYCERGATAARLAASGEDADVLRRCLDSMCEFLSPAETREAMRSFVAQLLSSAGDRALRHGRLAGRHLCVVARQRAVGAQWVLAVLHVALFSTPAWRLLPRAAAAVGWVRGRLRLRTRVRARLQRPAPASPRALVVSHHAERTGAAIVLRDLAAAGAFDDFDFDFLLMSGGPLSSDFAALAPSSHLGLTPGSAVSRVVHRLPAMAGEQLRSRVERRSMRRAVRGADLLYLNTALAGRVLAESRRRPPLVVSHIHELAGWLDHDPQATAAALSADAVIAVSRPVREELVKRGVPDGRITVVHEAIPTDRWPAPSVAERAQARATLGIDDGTFTVVAAGTVDHRKGADLFVAAAAELAVEFGCRFIWCGKATDQALAARLRAEVDQLGLGSVVTFLGEVERPLLAYHAADAFLLASREDPFPLVCLEAAATGLPVVVSGDAGGMKSFVEDDAGIVVGEASGHAFAGALRRLHDDDGLRAQMGGRAAAKVRERHDVGDVAKTIRALLHELANVVAP